MGPLINVYNEATLGFLVRRGAKAFCLPPELPFASIEILARAGAGAAMRASKSGPMAGRRWRFPRAELSRAHSRPNERFVSLRLRLLDFDGLLGAGPSTVAISSPSTACRPFPART